MLAYRAPEAADVAAIAGRMRDLDQRECRVWGHEPARALKLAMGERSWTASIDGEPQAMFGVMTGSLIEAVGHPWLLGTDEVFKAGKGWLRDAPHFLEQMKASYRRLENYALAENTATLRWLCRLGFSIGADPVTISGERMLHFWMEA